MLKSHRPKGEKNTHHQPAIVFFQSFNNERSMMCAQLKWQFSHNIKHKTKSSTTTKTPDSSGKIKQLDQTHRNTTSRATLQKKCIFYTVNKTIKQQFHKKKHTLRSKGSRNLKGSISTTYLEPLKGSIQNPF